MLANIPEGESSDRILTYYDYLEEMFPKTDDGDRADEAKEEIRRLAAAFAKVGGPGVKFKNPTEKLLKTLTLPKGAKEELGITDDG